ncbi:hypothetical protein D3C72_1202600 [compost metagenome]
MLVRRNRQHGREQRIEPLEIVSETVAQPLRSLLGLDVVLHGRVGCGEHRPGHHVEFIVAPASGSLQECGLHLHDVEAIEDVEGKVPLQRGNAHRLHDASDARKRLCGSLHRCGHLGIDWPETGLHKPAHSNGSGGRAAHARIKRHGARSEGIRTIGPRQERVSKRDVANTARHRPYVPESTRRSWPDTRHRNAPVGGLQRRDARLCRRPAHGDRQIGAQA